MSESDDMRSQVSALRDEVAVLRDEVADVRVLASLADHDVAGVRVTVNAFARTQNALRETQLEHGRTLDGHTRVLTGIAETVGALTLGLATLDATVQGQAGSLARLAAGQEEILRRLPPAP